MLATLKELRDYLGETGSGQDPRLTAALVRATDIINAYCNRRSLESAVYTDELVDGSGTDTLQLDNYPITAVASLYEAGAALTVGLDPNANPAPEVIWYGTQGHLVRPFGMFLPWPRYYKVTYTAGYAAGSIPPAIVQAVLDRAALIAKEKDRIGLQSKTTGNQVVNYTRDIPKEIKAGLDYYRDLSVARSVA